MKTALITGFRTLVILALAGAPLTPYAADWPSYRGPNHDGVSSETIHTNWTAEPPEVLWRVPLNGGLSSFAVSGGRAFTQVKREMKGQNREVIVALDIATGTELWFADVDLAAYPNAGVGSGDGPRTTPTVDGDRVYVLGSYLKLSCLNVTDGSEVWSRDLMADYGYSGIISWQNSASPLIEGDLLLVNAQAGVSASTVSDKLLGLNKSDGSQAWRSSSRLLTHATPVMADIHGVRQAVFVCQGSLRGVSPQTGELLWDYPYASSTTSTAASPVVGGDIVFCSAGYTSGGAGVRIAQNGQGQAASELYYAQGQRQSHWSTAVHHEGHLYGLFGRYSRADIRCMNLESGEMLWTGPNVHTGGILLIGNVLLVLGEGGELILVEPTPTEYREIARFDAVSGQCWNAPAVSNGIIFARSMTEAVAIDVSLSPPPALTLAEPGMGLEGSFGFEIRTEDGTPITQDRVAGLSVWWTSALPSQTPQWTVIPVDSVLTNGVLRVVDPEGAENLRRFYQVQETPQ